MRASPSIQRFPARWSQRVFRFSHRRCNPVGGSKSEAMAGMVLECVLLPQMPSRLFSLGRTAKWAMHGDRFFSFVIRRSEDLSDRPVASWGVDTHQAFSHFPYLEIVRRMIKAQVGNK